MAPENGISGGDERRVTGTGKRNEGKAKGPKETRIRRCIRVICRSMDTCIACICHKLCWTMACACAGERFSLEICTCLLEPPKPSGRRLYMHRRTPGKDCVCVIGYMR